jgi:hypothetical protein
LVAYEAIIGYSGLVSIIWGRFWQSGLPLLVLGIWVEGGIDNYPTIVYNAWVDRFVWRLDMPRISALTLSGGRLSDFGGHKAVKEYRVWVHPKRGDDFYYAISPTKVKSGGGYKDLLRETAKLRKSGKFVRVETPLAVVYDPRYKKYREVVIGRSK